MVILSDRDLEKLIEEEDAIYVEEGPELDLEKQLGSASVDLRVGYLFRYLERGEIAEIDTKDLEDYKDSTREIRVDRGEPLCLSPGQFLLGTTIESIKVPEDMVARVEGRSSYARLGFIPHAAAGYIDPGFEGQITLEIKNLAEVPVKIYPEDRVCQAVFEKLTTEVDTSYGERPDSKYMHQKGATESNLDLERS
ncbi:hypothetical protein AKJ51_03180 [candidate division MSBL1 archaeon SCGC-AAA382A20]|uniref:dCTP deaminase, dUMP-forming n=1 Tax=candidate division MSBL1 archaeon SCGC-AAA382A20 TaxID=1698280 RepID=A0A133VJS9_9EURY|nr:hypothetical protein AKJ51_03180 [candidate division MSBL1 archaeon SCGC-AAA382A20]